MVKSSGLSSSEDGGVPGERGSKLSLWLSCKVGGWG